MVVVVRVAGMKVEGIVARNVATCTIFMLTSTFCGVYNKPYDVDVFTFGCVYSNYADVNTLDDVYNHDVDVNTFGDVHNHDVDVNTFGNDVDVNTFGNDVDINTFGNDVDVNTFRDERTELKICYCKR